MNQKVAIFIYEPIQGDASRVYRAMRSAREFLNAGDKVDIVFDGSGTESLAEMLKPSGRFNSLYLSVKDAISGACNVCSRSHKVAEEIESAGIPLLDEFEGEASLRKYVSAGYTILNF